MSTTAKTKRRNGTQVNGNDRSTVTLDVDRWFAGRAEVDVSNAAVAAEWLRTEMGRGPLSGVFSRGGQLVHTPREGEGGYVPLSDATADADGPAQIRAADAEYVAAQVQYRYQCVKPKGRGISVTREPAMFPLAAAKRAVQAAAMLPHVRRLAGVVHTPIPRADGSLLDTPGYDDATGLLYLPEPGLHIPKVSARPSKAEVKAAGALLAEMVAGFPFGSDDHRANYLGALLTPLLRNICPPPYKLIAVEAHQPGSGKTLLASLVRMIHGGVFRSEMPDDDAELRKQVTSILTQSTGPVVLIDNVSGTLRSSTMAGLLTSRDWDDRPLGSSQWVTCDNDRLWMITGNNLAIGGDLPRRTIRVAIDPDMPNPELRTGFAIEDLETWVRQHRGQLLHALLTLIRAWVVAGRPMPAAHASDSYATWIRTVRGILTTAGLPGEFDGDSTKVKAASDDDDWRELLEAVARRFGDRAWTAREMLAAVSAQGPDSIPIEVLPDRLAERAERHPSGVIGVARSLGRYLKHRAGRWYNDLTVKAADTDDHAGAVLWRIERRTPPGSDTESPPVVPAPRADAPPATATVTAPPDSAAVDAPPRTVPPPRPVPEQSDSDQPCDDCRATPTRVTGHGRRACRTHAPYLWPPSHTEERTPPDA